MSRHRYPGRLITVLLTVAVGAGLAGSMLIVLGIDIHRRQGTWEMLFAGIFLLALCVLFLFICLVLHWVFRLRQRRRRKV